MIPRLKELYKKSPMAFVGSFAIGMIYSALFGLLAVFGAKIGENCVIKPHVTIYDPEKLVLGHNVWVGEHVDLYSLSAINIHHNVVISQYCFLCTGSHSISDNFATISKPIEILSNTWICAKCTVLPGAIVGVDETIYSAGSILK